MTIELIWRQEDFFLLEDKWNKLLERSQNDSVFLTFEWLKAWWIAFGEARKLFILLLKDEEKGIKGIAPLMLSRGACAGLPIKKMSFIYNDNASSADFLFSGSEEEAIGELIDYLEANSGKWDVLVLQDIPHESPTYVILQNVLKKKKITFGIKQGLNSPFIPIDNNWKLFFSNRSKKFRKSRRHIINRISKSESYKIEKFENNHADQEILNRLFDISARSWKKKYKWEITASRENQRFFEELTHLAGEKGWSRIWLLDIGGVPAAYEYHLKYKDKIYALRADFDSRYKDLSPGSVLDMHIMKAYFEDSIREYDLCGHEDPYKKNWTDLFRRHSTFYIYQDSLYGKILYLFDYRILYFLKAFLRKFAWARKLKKYLFSLLY